MSFRPTEPIRLSLMARTVEAMAQVLPRSESGSSRSTLPFLMEVLRAGCSFAWRQTGQMTAAKAASSSIFFIDFMPI